MEKELPMEEAVKLMREVIKHDPMYGFGNPRSPQCNRCRKALPRTTCQLYPKGIPKGILVQDNCPDYEPEQESK